VLLKQRKGGFDDMLLIKLMGITGVVVDRLQKPIVEQLVIKIVEMV